MKDKFDTSPPVAPIFITGLGDAFPKRVVTNRELSESLSKNYPHVTADWIEQRTGVRERRISEPQLRSEACSGLATRAARQAPRSNGKAVGSFLLSAQR